jgi:carbon-monoxide dehydrogenase small subunit
MIEVQKKTIRLKVNGEVREVDVKPHWTLLRVLRDELGLTGTKRGCETGECGACTVLMNGKPAPSCMVLAMQAEGYEITTIEGLSKGGELHPIQEAFIENHGVQCGFCVPGLILVTKAMLDEIKDPSEEEIKYRIGGNLCRCGNYTNIIKSIMAAAERVRKKEVGRDG